MVQTCHIMVTMVEPLSCPTRGGARSGPGGWSDLIQSLVHIQGPK